jgi:hypothetical protein
MTHVIHVLVLKRYIITRSMRKDNMSFFQFHVPDTLSDLKTFHSSDYEENTYGNNIS